MPVSSRQAAIRKARELQAFQPLFLDTETTGLGAVDEIVEIAIVDSAGSVLFESFIKPTRPIPPESTAINHISNDMLRGAPVWREAWPQVEAVLKGRWIGTYNADFDLRMFKQSHIANGMAWDSPPGRFFCVMKLYADFYPYSSGKFQRLEDAGRRCGIVIPNSHRAKDDTQLARAVFNCMARATP